MRTMLPLVLCVSLAVTAAAQEIPPQPPEATSPTTTAPEAKPLSTADGILRVTYEPGSIPINDALLWHWLGEVDLLRAAVLKAAGLPPDTPRSTIPGVQVSLPGTPTLRGAGLQWHPPQSPPGAPATRPLRIADPVLAAHHDCAKCHTGASITGTPGPGVALIEVSVRSFDERAPAAKVLDALAAELGERVGRLDRRRDDAERLMHRWQMATAQLSKELSDAQARLMAVSATTGTPAVPELAAQNQLRLQSEIQSMNVQLQGLEARCAVLEKLIAQLGAQVGEDAKKDPVLKELEKSVELRKSLVNTVRARAAARQAGVDQSDLLKAMDELAQAEAEVAKFRRVAADAAGGQRITELRRRLEDANIEIAEVKAKRQALDKPEELARGARDVEAGRTAILIKERLLRERSEEMARLTSQLDRYVAPRVEVIPLAERNFDDPAPSKLPAPPDKPNPDPNPSPPGKPE